MKGVKVVVDGRVPVVLTKKGKCKRCGEVIVYAPTGQMWLHADRIRGSKYYDHEAKAGR